MLEHTLNDSFQEFKNTGENRRINTGPKEEIKTHVRRRTEMNSELETGGLV